MQQHSNNNAAIQAHARLMLATSTGMRATAQGRDATIIHETATVQAQADRFHGPHRAEPHHTRKPPACVSPADLRLPAGLLPLPSAAAAAAALPTPGLPLSNLLLGPALLGDAPAASAAA